MSERMKRILLATLGVLNVAVAAVGAVVPGIPTLGPLLFGSLLLAKSNPALEKRLVRNRFFARYLPYIDGQKEMTPRAKWTAACMMWISIGISCLMLVSIPTIPRWAIGLLPVAGCVGSVFIWRFGKRKSGQAQPLPDDSPEASDCSTRC